MSKHSQCKTLLQMLMLRNLNSTATTRHTIPYRRITYVIASSRDIYSYALVCKNKGLFFIIFINQSSMLLLLCQKLICFITDVVYRACKYSSTSTEPHLASFLHSFPLCCSLHSIFNAIINQPMLWQKLLVAFLASEITFSYYFYLYCSLHYVQYKMIQ